jgi:ferrochelatase
MSSVSGAASALVLVNLGTPETPTPGAVRRFLRQFLSDRRVVELPRLLWLPLLYGIILPLRSPKVAKLYEKIWWPDGSPLRVITQRQAQKLSTYFTRQGHQTLVRFAMVYGEPSLQQVIDELLQQGIRQVTVLPLYPQFCSATTGSVCDQVSVLRKRTGDRTSIRLIKSYHDDPRYIAALADSIRRFRVEHGAAEKLLFSFHGIPQALADRGDPYFQQCHETANAVAASMGLAASEWQLCFQSRFGRAEWVKPYTDVVIASLAAEGCKTIDIVTPAFAADCLETLEEIAVQNAAAFLEMGGERLRLIPCLNDDDAHIETLAELYLRQLPG